MYSKTAIWLSALPFGHGAGLAGRRDKKRNAAWRVWQVNSAHAMACQEGWQAKSCLPDGVPRKLSKATNSHPPASGGSAS